MAKDLTTALSLAQHTATPAPLSETCRELWVRAGTQLEPGADHTAVVSWIERLAGTSLTNE